MTCDRSPARELTLWLLQVLNRIAENILNYPEDPKYRKLSTTKDTMKEHIMKRKGTVEFLQKVCSFRAVFRRLTNTLWTKMGFREKVSGGVISYDLRMRFSTYSRCRRKI